MPGVPVTCGDYRVLTTNAHGLRVQRAPGISLRPLIILGERFLHNSSAPRRGGARVRLEALKQTLLVMPGLDPDIYQSLVLRQFEIFTVG